MNSYWKTTYFLLIILTVCLQSCYRGPTLSEGTSSSAQNPVEHSSDEDSNDTQDSFSEEPTQNPSEQPTNLDDLDSVLAETHTLLDMVEAEIQETEAAGRERQEYLAHLDSLCSEGVQDACDEFNREIEKQLLFQAFLLRSEREISEGRGRFFINELKFLCEKGIALACSEYTKRLPESE